MGLILQMMRWIKSVFSRRFYFFKFLLPSCPISRQFGSERGTPIDRYYIDRFMACHRHDIHGDVLEIGSPAYGPRFGKEVKTMTILHYEKKDSPSTIWGDLERHETLPRDGFDCFICPQTFQYIYDFERGIRGAYQMLKEGGVLLATLPAVSQTSVAKTESWKEYWRFRQDSVVRGFSNVFGASNILVNSYGNVMVGTCFLYGFSLEEIPKANLEDYDPDYPFLFTVRAIKRTRTS
ncbi:MAG: methyltransferase [Candidatus Omnitrophica bacterium]|nr:methyltransferase [Candidatus Omnitrophota bacterium]